MNFGLVLSAPALASCEDSEARRDPEAEAGRGSGPFSMPFVWGWVGGEELCGCVGGVGALWGWLWWDYLIEIPVAYVSCLVKRSTHGGHCYS